MSEKLKKSSVKIKKCQQIFKMSYFLQMYVSKISNKFLKNVNELIASNKSQQKLKARKELGSKISRNDNIFKNCNKMS